MKQNAKCKQSLNLGDGKRMALARFLYFFFFLTFEDFFIEREEKSY